ncbi:MBL fold metallo-hydrolase [Paenibacillus popilliae]|uniref:MBL fold metallo-hydrolase n=1 Tax=Paenibacillus popilliae TaxID=78057 RepID=UPI0021AF058F|nr:MBL fold metallo-hydrolase [Paenibacillus sp. SDF0028]
MENKTYRLHQFKTSSLNFINYNYIIIDKVSGQAAIVDPSWDLELIVRTFEHLGVQPASILLTHSHMDHVNMVNPLVERYDSQVFMSAEEINFYGFRCKNLNSVHDFDVLNLGFTELTFLLTPGHTVGGMCFLLTDHLFTGDTIFIEGCGACTSKGGSPEQMFESICKIKRTVKPHVCICPGHSYGKEPGYPLSYLMHNNIYFQIEKEEYFIQFRMRNNQKNLLHFK